MPFLNSLKLDGILSFPPGSEAIPLTPLNVLIGPNGSGKSNLIEGIDLLHSLPTGFASAIREGGGVREWLWKGERPDGIGSIEAHIGDNYSEAPGAGYGEILDARPTIRYRLSFAAPDSRVVITDEVIEDLGYPKPEVSDEEVYLTPVGNDPQFYYHFQDGNPVVNAKSKLVFSKGGRKLVGDKRSLDPKTLKTNESILSQLKDAFVYPELSELGLEFERIRSFREWSFGPGSEVRQSQRTDMPADALLPDSRNLGLILNQLEHSGSWDEFNSYMSRFLPRYERCTTTIVGGAVQFFLHETGMKTPIPATRLSDGTIRFMAILALLLSPSPPPLICMEEPELGLHPDAVALLAELLHEVSNRTQLIVTTHSDALISALTVYADSVLVCEYRGGTVMKRVDSSKLKFWLDKYSLGEIWRIGEIGGNL